MSHAVVKVRLKNLIKDKHVAKINEVVHRVNIITTHLYQFMRLWILTLDDIPEITVDTLSMCCRVISEKDNRGAKPQGENAVLCKIFQEFYDTTYSKLGYPKIINGRNLGTIMDYASRNIITAIENNIKLHYMNRVRSFVNKYFVPEIKEECNTIVDAKLRSAKRKELRKELYVVKEDIFKNTLKSPEKYHNWILLHRPNIIPENFNLDNLYVYPQTFFKYMIYMGKQLETDGKKKFQFFPLKSGFIHSHITIDTTVLVDLFSKGTKQEDMKNIKRDRDITWGKFLKQDKRTNKLINDNKRKFAHMITTNGYDVSVLCLSPEGFAKKDKKTTAMVESSINSRIENQELSQEEIDQKHQTKISNKKEQEMKQIKTSKEENKGKQKVREFTYLEDSDDLENFDDTNTGIEDPGNIRIITMLNRKNGKIFKYTRNEHIQRTQRYKIRRQRNKRRNELKITKMERWFAMEIEDENVCSKSCIVENFQKYILKRNTILNTLVEKYEDEKFRRLRFHAYINKTRARDNLVNNIKKFLGPNSKLVVGNCNSKSLKHTEPVPGINLKRYLAKHFKTYDIDEFRTSIVCSKTNGRCDNLYLKNIENNKYEKIHSVLTFKMENGKMGCINRDRNAVLNMNKIISQILTDGTYPEVFLRTTKMLPTLEDRVKW